MEKINLMVCPHDTAQKPERWFLFAQSLGKLSDRIISFKSSIDFAEFHKDMAKTGLVYANPQDALSLYQDHGFIPLARPFGTFDEVVFIANKDINDKTLQSINSQSVASVTSMLPTALALTYLKEQGIKPNEVQDRASWVAVIRAVSSGEVPFGFIYQDFFESLNELSKSTIERVETTLTKRIHHMVLIHPDHADIAEDIKDILLNMHTISESVKTMSDMGFSHFEAADESMMKVMHNIKCGCNETTKEEELEQVVELV